MKIIRLFKRTVQYYISFICSTKLKIINKFFPQLLNCWSPLMSIFFGDKTFIYQWIFY